MQLQMTTPENTLQYAIDSMERASKELSSLADSLPVGEGMEAFDVHSLRTALEFIAEGSFLGMSCASNLFQFA